MQRAAALVLVASSCVHVTLGAAETGPCGSTGKPDTTFTKSFPRFNFQMASVSAEMEDYDWITWDKLCTRKPLICYKSDNGVIDISAGGGQCDPGCYTQNAMNCGEDGCNMESLKTANDPKAGFNYIQGMVTYAILFLGLMVLSIPLGLVCCSWTCCCCCKQGCWADDSAVAKDDADDPDGEHSLANKRSCCQIMCNVVSVLMLLTAIAGIGVGFFMGNNTLEDAMVSLVDGPKGFADLANSGLNVGVNVIDVADKVLNIVERVEHTVTSTVNLTELNASLSCVGNLLDNMPDPAVLMNELTRINTGLNLVPAQATVTNLMAGLTNTLDALDPQLSAVKGNISLTTSALTTVIDGGILDTLITDIPSAFTDIGNAQTSAGSVKTNVDGMVAALPSDTLVARVNTELGEFSSNQVQFANKNNDVVTTNGEEARRIALKTDLTSMRDALNSVSGLVDGVKSSMGSFNTSLNNLDTKMSNLGTEVNKLTAALSTIPNLTVFGGHLTAVNATLKGFDVDGIEGLLKTVQNVTTGYLPNAPLIKAEMAKVTVALDGITCVASFATVITAVNTSLIRVPKETDAIVGELQNMDAMSAQIRGMTSGLEAQIDDFNKTAEQLAKLDTAGWLTQVGDLRTQLDSAATMTGKSDSLGDMDKKMSDATSSDVSAQITKVTTELGGATVPASLDSSLTSLKTDTTAAAGKLQDMIDVIVGWEGAGSEYVTGMGATAVPSEISAANSGMASSKTSANDLSAGLTSFVNTVVPSSSSYVTQMNDAKTALTDAKTEVASMDTTIGSVQSQLGSARTVESSISTQWSSVSSVLTSVQPTIKTALTNVKQFESAMKAVPADVKTTFKMLEGVVQNMITMQRTLADTMNSTRAQTKKYRADIETQRDNPLTRIYRSNDTAPSFAELTPKAAMELIKGCRSAACMKAGIHYMHDNLGDMAGAMAGEMSGGEAIPVGIGIKEMNLILYTFSAIALFVGLISVVLRNRTCRWLSIILLMWVCPLFLLIGGIWYPFVAMSTGICSDAESTGILMLEQDTHLGLNSKTILLRNASSIEELLHGVIGDKFNLTYPITDAKVSGMGPLIKHYFQDCSADPQLQGLDTLVNYAGGLAENITVEFIDWGTDSVKNVGELRPKLIKHIGDLRSIANEDVPKLVKELAQLAGCKKVNDAYFQMKSAWCCGITVSLWYMSLGAIMIGMCGCCSMCSMGLHDCCPRKVEEEDPDDTDALEMRRLGDEATRQQASKDAEKRWSKNSRSKNSAEKRRGPQRPDVPPRDYQNHRHQVEVMAVESTEEFDDLDFPTSNGRRQPRQSRARDDYDDDEYGYGA